MHTCINKHARRTPSSFACGSVHPPLLTACHSVELCLFFHFLKASFSIGKLPKCDFLVLQLQRCTFCSPLKHINFSPRPLNTVLFRQSFCNIACSRCNFRLFFFVYVHWKPTCRNVTVTGRQSALSTLHLYLDNARWHFPIQPAVTAAFAILDTFHMPGCHNLIVSPEEAFIISPVLKVIIQKKSAIKDPSH